MTQFDAIDLARLAPPQVVETLSFEGLVAAMKADFAARFPDFTANLESDPAIKILEVAAYRELVLRARVNDAARANLLAFAGGSDLDHLAAFYGVTRLADETDEALRDRVRERIVGWSSAGGAAHYRYWALTADPRVTDAAVSSPMDGAVVVSVLSSEGDGTADADLLAAVSGVVLADHVRVLTDTVSVVSAEIVTVDVAVRVWLRPGTPAAVVDALRDGFPAAFTAARGLGIDVTLSWLMRTLHGDGVHRVVIDTPSDIVRISPTQCAALGAFTVSFEGIDQ